MRWISLLFLFVSLTALADSSVWVVSKGDKQLFIGGTIHMLSPTDYPLPAEFEQAYQKANLLVFETDISKVNSPEFQMTLLQRLSYSDGKTLRGELGKKAYAALEKFSAERSIPLESLQSFKPQMVILALLGVELQRMGMMDVGVDQHFFQRAQRDKKNRLFLESPAAQLDVLANMGRGQEDLLILNTVRDLQKIDSVMAKMKAAWRAGLREKLAEAGLAPMQKEFPALYQSLLVKRNQAWLARIENMLKTTDIEFVLVGALHMVGKDGVLKMLTARGYTVKNL
ncbi:MAG: TraB/GumN family protein [Gammaproteobacteria bacterium]|nr:TraB/GumN family protein [Gammaproteobacteria bacterium]